MSRFIVTELEGYSIAPTGRTAGNAHVGLSCMVIDTLVNRRLMGVYRTEDHTGRARYLLREKVRRLAAELVCRLEAECAP